MIYSLNIKRFSRFINGKNIFITGGTGSFGNMMTETLLTHFKPNKIIIFSRDEYKQYLMQKKFSSKKYSCLRYFIGDIRDYDRLEDALKGVNLVFHAAALKQVPAVEYNPTEAIKTNIYGSENIIRASIKNNVERVVAISTDKCVNPINLYGATKLCFERLFSAANAMSGENGTIFSILRYGNVLGSRGSVLPVFLKQKETGTLMVTDKDMTRFTITLQEAINFVLVCTDVMIGGEVFIPKIPSYKILQLANVIAPKCKIKYVGIRPGEKLHEKMISEHESHFALECDNFYVIKPFSEDILSQDYDEHYKTHNCKKCPSRFIYISSDNEFIDDNLLKKMIDDY
jgi:UDP-N-acetylglucosamine 4,6-dehydratase